MNFSVVVFDVGRTLMEYKDMPNSWLDYYPKAFEHVNQKLGLNLDAEQLNKSLEIFRSFSPSINYREHDCTPEEIFSEVTAGWNKTFKLSDVIDAFFESMNLQAYIYPDTVPVLKKLNHLFLQRLAQAVRYSSRSPDSVNPIFFLQFLKCKLRWFIPFLQFYLHYRSDGQILIAVMIWNICLHYSAFI